MFHWAWWRYRRILTAIWKRFDSCEWTMSKQCRVRLGVSWVSEIYLILNVSITERLPKSDFIVLSGEDRKYMRYERHSYISIQQKYKEQILQSPASQLIVRQCASDQQSLLIMAVYIKWVLRPCITGPHIINYSGLWHSVLYKIWQILKQCWLHQSIYGCHYGDMMSQIANNVKCSHSQSANIYSKGISVYTIDSDAVLFFVIKLVTFDTLGR